MKMTVNPFVTTAALFLATSPLPAQPIGMWETINFDDVRSGTVVDAHYAGVAFINIGATYVDEGRTWSVPGGNVYAVADPETASQPNAVSVLASGGGFNVMDGVIQATFSETVLSVSIDVVPELLWSEACIEPTQNAPYLEAFDANGNLVAQASYPQANLANLCAKIIGPKVTLTCTSTTANISSVRFSSSFDAQEATVLAVLDNLRYLVPIYPRPIIPPFIPPLRLP